MNTNLHDISSIIGSPRYKEYIARANRKDTTNIFNEIIKEINKRNLIFPFMSGDDLTTSSVLNEINKKFKYIIVMRHPLDLVFRTFLVENNQTWN